VTKTVVITGAGQGIGAALARRWARTGNKVALLDMNGRAAADRASELTTDGGNALAIECDVTREDDCRAAVAQVAREWGGVDILVANAGITHLGLARDTDVAVLRRVMEVNFFGAVHASQAALPSLLERRGQIVVMSSVAGFAPLATRAGYSASKHALEGYYASLRAEHKRDGLRVTMVRPSFVRTDIGDSALAGDGSLAGAGKRIVLVGGEAQRAHWASKLAPRFYEAAMIRRSLGS